MIHFDAHADTGDIEFGSLYGHGQPMRRLIESGALRGDRFLQMGLRGYWPGPETLDWMAEQRMRSYEMTEIGKRGLDECLDEAFEIALDECDAVFLSVDIDVCDPGHAPGTGTPEPGGLSSRQLLDAVRRICRELPVAGIDVVEVSPPYDHAEITALPRQPGLPRGALRPGRPEARHHPRPRRTAPGRALSGAPRRSSTGPSSTGGATSAPAPSSWTTGASRRWATPTSTAGGCDRRPGRRPAQPRLHGRARAPHPGRSRAVALRPVGALDAGGVPRRDPRVRRPPPRPRVGARRRVGDAGVPGRHPDRGRPRRRGARAAGVPAQPRPPRRLGQQQGPRDRRHRREHAGPSRRPDRARPRGPPERHPARGRHGPGVAVPSARPRARTTTPA